MTEEENLKCYGRINGFRLLNIDVILDDSQLIYQGTTENAPDNIKMLNYSKIDMGNPMKVYVYSSLN